MPTITAKRRSRCTVCPGWVEVGERIAFDSVQGARHLACADQQPAPRVNEHGARCSNCDRWLEAGRGELSLHEETLPNGAFARVWRVHCAQGCNTALRSPLVRKRRH